MDAYTRQVRLSLGKDFSEFIPVSIQFNQLPALMCSPNVLYSPAQFKDNRRRAANFLGFADFLCLDFDEGWSQELASFFNQFIGYLVPTRHNMLEKNGIICERYRVVLLLNTQINLSYKEHKRLYKHIIRDLKLPADTSCVDACRFYFSAEQPVSNCIQLAGTQYFPWEKYNYRDLQYASLDINKEQIDVSKYKNIDVSYFANLHHSKRYPCPLCQLEGLDQKGHHLGFNKDDDYPSCFYDESHSKILRKLYKQYKYGEIENNIEEINDMVREKCTPDLIKTAKYDPKPTNYNSSLHDFYDKALDLIEQDDWVDLDIETFCEDYVAETYEEAEARLKENYKYIKGAYNSKWDEYKGVALDPLKNKIRIITLGGNGATCPFDMYYVREDQKKRILELIRDRLVTGCNLKFDISSIIAKYGLEYCPKYCFDTMLASRMIHMAQDPEDSAIGHGLEAGAYRFLGHKMDKSVEHTWGDDNLSPRQLQYAGNDVKVLRPLVKEQIRQFKELYGPFDTEHYDIEKIRFLGPLVDEHPILALEMQTLLEVIRIEHKGVKPNIDMMLKKMDYYNDFIDKTDAALGINCGSSKQCVEYLQKYVSPKITSSSSGVLWDYEEYPGVRDIIESKQARTRRGLMESMSSTNVHPYDGRIHAHFNQLLNTGRFACSKPNMQQIPKDIKNTIYVSDANGAVFDTDYAAVELRIETVVANDPVMLEAYRNKVDMHYFTASKMFNKEIPHTHEEKEDAEKNPNTKFINKWERGYAKSANFGLIYGLALTSWIAMSKGANPDITDAECEKSYNAFFDTYKGVKAIIDNAKMTFLTGKEKHITRWVKYANGSFRKLENKTVPFFTTIRTLFGRILAVDTERKMMNYATQGSGSDIIKLAICTVGYNTRKDKTSYTSINLVHDDTIAESDITDFDVNSEHFRNALRFAVNYILRYKFHTEVNQDFCVLSLFGKEIFLEEALTVKDIETKLIERLNHDNKILQDLKDTDENDSNKEKMEDLVKTMKRYYEVLQELQEKNKQYNLY